MGVRFVSHLGCRWCYALVRANQASADYDRNATANKALRESNLTLTGEVEAWRNVETVSWNSMN